ncbi:MAG: hypothetical protein WD749_15200 [Phycisphaerales bacterium]
MDVLVRIKRLVLRGAVRFTDKARDEMDLDGLTAEEVLESVINAPAILKTLRSTSPLRRYAGERLYVIKGRTYDGTVIYTKGAIHREAGSETFYIFISSKLAAEDGRG